jgi:hypothetical protein
MSHLVRSPDEQNRVLWPHLNVLDVRVVVAEAGVVFQKRILEVARVRGQTSAAEKHGGACVLSIRWIELCKW